MQHVVGLGDVEQAFEHVLEQLAVALEHDRELLGISLVAGHILLGEVEDTSDVLHLAFRHLEHFLEGVDLVHGDDAVGLRHLGAERDHANGEGHLVLGRAVLLLIAIDDIVPGDAAEQSADGPADCEPAAAPANFPQIDIARPPTNTG